MELHERQESILSILRNNPNVSYSTKFFVNMFSVSHSTINRDINELARQNKDIIRTAKNVSCVAASEKIDRYPASKTNEGYNDPTAASVIKKLDAADYSTMLAGNPTPQPGDVWNIERQGSNTTEKFIIVSINMNNDYATCIQYFVTEAERLSKCTKMYSKPLKYFVDRCWSISTDELAKIRSRLGEYLQIVAVQEPVQKSDDPFYILENTRKIEILQAKLEVYDSCFKMMCGVKEKTK